MFTGPSSSGSVRQMVEWTYGFFISPRCMLDCCHLLAHVTRSCYSDKSQWGGLAGNSGIVSLHRVNHRYLGGAGVGEVNWALILPQDNLNSLTNRTKVLTCTKKTCQPMYLILAAHIATFTHIRSSDVLAPWYKHGMNKIRAYSIQQKRINHSTRTEAAPALLSLHCGSIPPISTYTRACYTRTNHGS